MTDLVPVLVVLVPAIPLVGAGLALLARTTRQADRLAIDHGGRDCGRRADTCLYGLRARGPDGAARPLVPARRRQRPAARGNRRRRTVQRARLAVVPADERPQLDDRCPLTQPVLRRPVRVLGGTPRRSRDRQPRRRVADRRGDDRRLGLAGRVHRASPRARRGLEVPRPDDSRSIGRAARDHRAGHRPGQRRAPRPARARLAHAAARRSHAAEGPDADRVRAAPGRSRGQDRVGSRPQLAARCAQRGAGADQRAAVRGAASDRVAHRLARQADPRALGRAWAPRAQSSSPSDWPRCSWRSRFCGNRCRGSGCWRIRASSTWG